MQQLCSTDYAIKELHPVVCNIPFVRVVQNNQWNLNCKILLKLTMMQFGQLLPRVGLFCFSQSGSFQS